MVGETINSLKDQNRQWHSIGAHAHLPSLKFKTLVYFPSLVAMILGFLLGMPAHGKDVAKVAKLLSTYQIRIDTYENFITNQAQGYQTGVLTSRHGKILIVAKDYVPQSINSVKARAQEDGASPLSVRIVKWKDRALFYYDVGDQFHVYSTLGGHLVISKKTPFKFDFKKLSLVGKPAKKVARL